MKKKIHICENCNQQVQVNDKHCPGCGLQLMDAQEAQTMFRITQKDVDAISAFLNIMLKSKVVMNDIMRHIRNIAKAYGYDPNSDSIDLRGFFKEPGKLKQI